MISKILFLIEILVSFLPFLLFAFLNGKVNTKKEIRYKQYAMPVIAVVYSAVLLIFMDKLSELCIDLFMWIASLFDKIKLEFVGEFIRNLYTSWGIYLTMILFNTLALLLYIILKRFVTLAQKKIKVRQNSFIGSAIEIFYAYDEQENAWYIRSHYGQAKTFIKTAYYASCILSGFALLVSCSLCMDNLISAPFYPVFAVIIMGEMAFFIDGLTENEKKSTLAMEADKSRHIAMYPLLRKPLKVLFGDKLSAEGTTVNNGGISGTAVEDILSGLEKECGHIGKNYAAFIRKKASQGLKPNVDYVRCGYDLSVGKSLLFNTPFYDKLNPYVFYAINRCLLTGGKVMVVLGRHGTEEDLYGWCEKGMLGISNVPDLWKIGVLSGKKVNEYDLPDIGIISRSGVHDLDIHKNNLPFLKKVSFVVIVEPSRLVATAQIGLNLLIKCCGADRKITFCSVDRNCDGLVDAMSHILMTNITEVSATEYPHGMSSYMYWTADDDYLQHRILPGVSRYLGMGTEFSMVALKNQVKKTVWYGGEAYPVLDAHWIAKQYYYDLLDYARLATNQETFDKCFCTSFNICNEKVSDYSFITVEDDRNNLFETRRNFATIAEEQGFVNVISSEYMLREYMSDNTEIFTADPKAIPYITADYARTRRNVILSLCLLLCIDSVKKEVLERQMVMMNIDTIDPVTEIWKEICIIFSDDSQSEYDKNGAQILTVSKGGKTVDFEKDSTILYKRQYSVESGKFESVYTIENSDFVHIILDDLQNASYIAEQETKDVYLGTELKGHIYQKYMPGQFFTLNGKYYEMVSAAAGNRILVRRAADHIGGRLSYRQVRNYTIHHIENSQSMGELKTVNNIDIHYQFADFSVLTPGYWKLRSHNDFETGSLVEVNGVPERRYYHKQILKFDFSRFGDSFTDSVRMTLTNLLNEVFVTLFAENQPFISAITPGNYGAPLTYSLDFDEGVDGSEKCIYIIEDSQLDIGLLVAVERNVNRIFQIISDYLLWNGEKIEESKKEKPEPDNEEKPDSFDAFEENDFDIKEKKKKKGFFGRLGERIKNLFKKKDKKDKKKKKKKKGSETEEAEATEEITETTVSDEVSEIEKDSDDQVYTTDEEEKTEAEESVEDGPESIPAPEEELSPKEKRKAEKLEKKRLKMQEKAAKKEEKALRKQKKKEAVSSEPEEVAAIPEEENAPSDEEEIPEAVVPADEESETEVSEDE